MKFYRFLSIEYYKEGTTVRRFAFSALFIRGRRQRRGSARRWRQPSRKKNIKVWYPTPGYRARNTGAMAHVGYEGFSWSSTVSGTSDYSLDFNDALLYPSAASSRAYGWQVRCLRE